MNEQKLATENHIELIRVNEIDSLFHSHIPNIRSLTHVRSSERVSNEFIINQINEGATVYTKYEPLK